MEQQEASGQNEEDTFDFMGHLKLLELKKQICFYRLKLKDCCKKYKELEEKICHAKQLKSKASYVLEETNGENDDLRNSLNEIHASYLASLRMATRDVRLDAKVSEKIRELTAKRNLLKEELMLMRESANNNDKKLKEAKSLITIQEKKNAALLRQLRKRYENGGLSQQLTQRIASFVDTHKIVETEDTSDPPNDTRTLGATIN